MAMTEKYANFNLATGLNDGSSEANAWQTPGDVVFAAGCRVNLKCLTRFDLTETWDISPDGGGGDEVSGPSWLRGYKENIVDGGKALIECSSNNIDTGNSASKVIMQNFDIEASRSGVQFDFRPVGMGYLENIKFVSTNASAPNNPLAYIGNSIATNCYFESQATAGNLNRATVYVQRTIVDGLVIKTKDQAGLYCAHGFAGNIIMNSLIHASTTSAYEGIYVDGWDTGRGTYYNTAIIGFDVGILFDVLDDSYFQVQRACANLIIMDAVVGIDTNDVTNEIAMFFDSCAFYNCITDVDSNIENNWPQINKISLTADPFTDVANNNYSLNNAAGGGALLRNARRMGGGVL